MLVSMILNSRSRPVAGNVGLALIRAAQAKAV